MTSIVIELLLKTRGDRCVNCVLYREIGPCNGIDNSDRIRGRSERSWKEFANCNDVADASILRKKLAFTPRPGFRVC